MNCFKKHYCPVCMEEKNCGINVKYVVILKYARRVLQNYAKKDKLINASMSSKNWKKKNVLQKYFKNNEKL